MYWLKYRKSLRKVVRKPCTEDQSEEKPQPRVPVGILSPQGTKGSKQKQRCAMGAMALNPELLGRDPALEIRNPALDLLDPLVKPILRKGGVGDRIKK